MCRGDEISGAELMQLMQHAILAPQLSRLVMVGEGIMGYPDKGGKTLRDYSGKFEPVKKSESLRIAHLSGFVGLEKMGCMAARVFRGRTSPTVQADLS